jgi:hypothetical protein
MIVTTTGGQTGTGGGTTGGATTIGASTGASSGTSGGSSSGSTTGSSTTGTSSGSSTGPAGGTGAVINAAAGETLGIPAIASAGGEAELFYGVSSDAGTRYELQHLSARGAAHGATVHVEATAALLATPPLVSVASNGMTIDCCWEDQGPPALPDSPSCPPEVEVSRLVRCASLAVDGKAVDMHVDGGYTDCGDQPLVTFGGGGGAVVVYHAPFTDEIAMARLYQADWPWAIFGGSGDVLAVASVQGQLDLFLPSDGGIGYFTMSSCGQDGLCSDYLVHDLPECSDPGSFAVAVNGTVLGIAIQRADGVTTLTVDTDAGVMTPAASLSTADEQPIGPVAASTCGTGFGYAYAIDGGDVRFRATAFDGTPSDGGSALVANLGDNAQSIALAPTDGGLLAAIGTPGTIGVYFVGCP